MGCFKRYRDGKLPNGLLKTAAGAIILVNGDRCTIIKTTKQSGFDIGQNTSNYGWDMIAVVKIGIKEYYEKV
jgi:hypothetical protein